MQIKKSQIQLLNLFKKNIFFSATIREISITIKKDYPTVYNAIKELSHKKIFTVKRIGGSKICELSLSSETISILSFLDDSKNS